jgi:CheY-like chemotaxis protein
VDLLEETGSLRRVVSYGPPDHPDVAEQLNGLYPPTGELEATSDPFRVARTSRVEMMLTGYGQPHDRRRAAEVGFDAYLVKPVDRDTLYRAIQAVGGPLAP